MAPPDCLEEYGVEEDIIEEYGCLTTLSDDFKTKIEAFLSVTLFRPSFEVTSTDGVKNNGFYLSTLLCY